MDSDGIDPAVAAAEDARQSLRALAHLTHPRQRDLYPADTYAVIGALSEDVYSADKRSTIWHRLSTANCTPEL